MNQEQEWRQFLLGEIRALRTDVTVIKNEMTTLKVKVGAFASLIGSIVTFIANKFLS